MSENFNKKKERVQIKTIFITYNLTCIKINFLNSINYQQYFNLTRVIAETCILYQYNNYATESFKSIFITHSCPLGTIIVDNMYEETYEDLLKFLSRFKVMIRKCYTCNNLVYVKHGTLVAKKEFIERLVASDIRHVEVSTRQLKSTINRSIAKTENQINQKRQQIKIITIEELIEEFDKRLKEWLAREDILCISGETWTEVDMSAH